ncbi:MAG: hypothetical protein ING36_05215 [Burkholderiales bacterium]|nr:hypothetical protein [Burkholderiales bacterium]
MKKLRITSNCLVPGNSGMKTAYIGTVASFDDDVAAALLAAQRAVVVADDEKEVDTTKQFEKPAKAE